jgi:EmrB/QacA subfamily drug resistance transporter
MISNAYALAAVCLSSLMFGLEISSIPAILPTLQHVLAADFQQLQWTMNAYTIAVATVLMATGTLADRYGRKRIYVITILAFGITSLLCGLAPNMPVLIIGRTLQGISGGAMLICQVAVLSQQFQDAGDRAKAFGWWGIIFGFGLGFGPLIGGGIAALFGWSWVFLIHALLAIATTALAVIGVRESKDPAAKHLDLAGILTLSLAVFCLVFYITQGSELGFASPTALGILAIALASLIAFVIAERRVRHPMFDFSVFRVRRFTGALLGSMGMNFAFWPFMIYLPIWFQAELGTGLRSGGGSGGAIAASAALLAYTLPTLVVPPYAERLALRHGAGFVIPLGLATIGLGFFIMAVATGIGGIGIGGVGIGAAGLGAAAWPATLIGALIAGAGLGATNTPVTNTTTGAVSSDRAGMASGIDMSARMISLALNIALMGFVLVNGVSAHLRATLGAAVTDAQLGSLAERIAAGDLAARDDAGLTAAIAHAALAQGFGWVMLYGAVSISVLAILSFLAFGRRAKPAAALCAR